MNGMRAIARPIRAVSQKEIAGLVRKANQISGSSGSGHSFGASEANIQARCVGPSACAQGELPTIGTRVRCALRPVGCAIQSFWLVALKCATMKPSSPGCTLFSRLSCGLLSRTVVPIVPPGTSSAPTRVASMVRAQQHS